jgi:hypothetical protein
VRNPLQNRKISAVDRALIVENKWRAQRYGVNGTFVSGNGTGAVTVADMLEQVLEGVMPHAEAVAKSLHAAGIQPTIASVTPGEASKSLAVTARLYDALATMPAERSTPIVAVGGGVVGDLAGFVAATWHRGVPLVQVPTSLLAMVDSSVGGKVGVNHPSGKNLIGAFHQPIGVWIDTAFLTTLPEREYRSGLAEVVKYGVILDAELFAWLEENTDAIIARETQVVERIINRCCELKARVVEADEREEQCQHESGGKRVASRPSPSASARCRSTSRCGPPASSRPCPRRKRSSSAASSRSSSATSAASGR